ncbi:astacin-like metalloendopeptidase [Pseudoliparis swirei]|uniref:astacin-like metalloendopeptidase n=1 Tax=Pseudoliparis swirei TaxID=2059687 RepID=UPI0024BE143C|nr:astacin-like metalloendopeptidase [Pseudoliparis swirei]
MLQLVLTALLLAGAQQGSCTPLRDVSQHDELFQLVMYLDSNPETLEELLSKDRALTEGDMVLSDDRNAVTSRWPTTAIPYVISPRLAGQRADIVAAMEMLSDQTCLSFLKRRSERDYLHFVRSFGCASFVGYDGGEQQIFIGSSCLVGNIVHEILHAMGFYHEHTRMDRDQYIKILYNNIMAGMEINYMTFVLLVSCRELRPEEERLHADSLHALHRSASPGTAARSRCPHRELLVRGKNQLLKSRAE